MMQLPTSFSLTGQFGGSRSWRPWWFVLVSLVAVAALLSLSLIVPGRTFSSDNTWDLLLLFDSAQRLLESQVPNRDFHTPFGPLTYLLLSGGYWLSGSLGGTFPVTTGLFVLLLFPLLIYTCASRLPWPLALLFGVHLLIVSIAPALTGDVAYNPTFGMFYNRFGWALLSLLLLFVLPRRSPFASTVTDALAMAALWSMMFYLKISYAAVAGVFLVAFIAFPHVRKAALGALLASAFVILTVEFFWSQTLEYLADLRSAAAASGALKGGLMGFLQTVLRNVQGLYLFACILLLAFIRGIRLDYLLLCVLAAGAGLAVANQNYQGPGILTLIPAALIAILAPRPANAPEQDLSLIPNILILGALAIPPDLAALITHVRHVSVASRAPDITEVSLDKLVTTDGRRAEEVRESTLDGCGRAAVPAHSPALSAEPGQFSSQAQYLAAVQDGMKLLTANPALSGKVFTIDMINPFNALLHRGLLVGGNDWYHAHRTFSLQSHPPAPEAFRAADVVMVPRVAVEYATFDLLRTIYGGYVNANFNLAARSACWDAYVRRRVEI